MTRQSPVAAAAAAALAAVVTLGAPAAAQPTRVTFAEYASATTREYAATFGQPVTSGGFDFYEAFGTDGYGTGSRNALGTWGTGDAGAANRPANLGASNTLYATTGAVELDMFVHGADPFAPRFAFDIYSIDVANLFGSGVLPPATGGPLGFSLTFFGYTAADPAGFSQTFSVPTPPTVGGVTTPVLQTLTFDARWRGVENVYWFQNNQFLNYQHQFTNVVAEVVPEPSAWLMVAAGLGGVLLAARGRRTA